ncbi:MAG: hypothetical protein H6831_06350 [Planctomycetes bacterium]|nr:hypothetical protein [Planctomycetota bacterium]MCB9904009.1 hypothetical protein [Planctomycetota bacterium]
MISVCVVLCLGVAGAQGNAFERSLEATAQGRYGEALRWADSEGLDSASRAQARFWALSRAGLLDLALAEAELGLEEAPRDDWLLGQAVEVALILHDDRRAEQHLLTWEASGGAPDAELRARVASGVRSAERVRAGSRRAMGVSVGLLAACVACFAAWLRGPR